MRNVRILSVVASLFILLLSSLAAAQVPEAPVATPAPTPMVTQRPPTLQERVAAATVNEAAAVQSISNILTFFALAFWSCGVVYVLMAVAKPYVKRTRPRDAEKVLQLVHVGLTAAMAVLVGSRAGVIPASVALIGAAGSRLVFDTVDGFRAWRQIAEGVDKEG